jgi:uncharacterized membrane protein YciS (DUF1049 family)
MVAQEWSGRKLTSSVYFEPDEQGLDLFTAYLSSLKHQPVRMLIDLIEEEFRQITIPLLRGPDRQEVLNRNFTKFFRNSEYRFATRQAIEKKRRKEERLLFMGLTNQYLLKPWLDIIHDTRTPLSGIVSLPLISEYLVPSFKDQNECVILVSQQVPSNLRQSVFIKGKLILSRLVPIASFYQGDYASDVVRDIEGTQRYLVSQRIIDRTDTISVNILSNKRHQEKLTVKCAEGGYFDYKIHDINDIIQLEKIEINEEQDFSSALFCFQATKKSFVNHYARNTEKKYFNHHLASMATKLVSIILITLGIGLFSTSLVKGMLYDQTVTEMEAIEQKYKSKFNQLSESRIDSTTSTTNMQDVVQAVEKIEKYYQFRPREMFVLLSQHVSLFDSVRIKDLEWFISNSSDTKAMQDVAWSQGGPPLRRSRSSNAPRAQKGLFEIAIIKGEFVEFDGNYRFALSAVDDLEDAMRVSGYYDEVQVLKRPLDIEPDKQLSGEITTSGRTREGVAEFSIRVVRKVTTDEK